MDTLSLNIFNKLPKYSGLSTTTDLSSWLAKFERCCTIANKKDELLQGQILMMSVDGQALAVLERFERECAAQQKYKDLKAHLISVFYSESERE